MNINRTKIIKLADHFDSISNRIVVITKERPKVRGIH